LPLSEPTLARPAISFWPSIPPPPVIKIFIRTA
jgi:hypothetical protein